MLMAVPDELPGAWLDAGGARVPLRAHLAWMRADRAPREGEMAGTGILDWERAPRVPAASEPVHLVIGADTLPAFMILTSSGTPSDGGAPTTMLHAGPHPDDAGGFASPGPDALVYRWASRPHGPGVTLHLPTERLDRHVVVGAYWQPPGAHTPAWCAWYFMLDA